MPICRVSNQPFDVTPEDLRFYTEIGPTIGGRRFEVPPPTISPDERRRRRLVFRNERYLYRNKCKITGKSVVSVYSPDKAVNVVEKDTWRKLDNCDFGRPFDFSRPFFEQFAELFRATYKQNVMQTGEMFNSEYCHFCGWLKNSYLCFDTGQSEDCHYTAWTGYTKDSMDLFYAAESELCYDSVRVFKCYSVFYSQDCTNCSFSAYLYRCIGCRNCIGCVNLRNKEYWVFNKPVGKAEYERVWQALFNGSYSTQQQFRAKFEEHRLAQPHRAVTIINSSDCTGDLIDTCERVFDSYNVAQGRDLKHCHNLYLGCEHSYDVDNWGEGMDHCYEAVGCGGLSGKTGISGILFSALIFYGGYDVLYSVSCIDKCQNLFGCCDLIKKQYCILNKQYSRDEYEALVPRIIEHMQKTGEWGEFFPMSVSLFGYNETLAQEEFPITPEEAARLNVSWSTYRVPASEHPATISARELPDRSADADDSLLEKAIVCEESAKPFRITKQELQFYRRHHLPLPRQTFIERHRQRHARLNPRKLWPRRCAVTGKTILSSFPPDRPEMVVCEEAYREALE